MASKESPADTHSKRDEESDKPGGKVIRGSGRGGIARANPSCPPYLLRSRIREAFMGSSALQMTKLTISDLDLSITDTDMYEFFSRFGPLKYAKVQCDDLGMSLGYAEVLFERRSDAIEAMKQSSGVVLEGRKISVNFSSQCKKPSPTIGSQKKHRRKCNRRPMRALRSSTDDLTATELGECMSSRLNISDD